MKKGTKVICIDAIEGYLTNGKVYESQGLESYAGRLVVTDDNGKEGHFKPERFQEVLEKESGEKKERQRAKIDKWSIMRHPFYNDFVLRGQVKDHPRQSDMKTDVQVTSPLLSIDFVKKIAETKNTTYVLLEEDKSV